MRYWKVQHPDGTWSDPLPTWTAAALYAQQVNGTIYAY